MKVVSLSYINVPLLVVLMAAMSHAQQAPPEVKFPHCNDATPYEKKDASATEVLRWRFLRAIRRGGTDCVRELLEAGADPNESGGVPLFLAFGDINMQRLLLDHGANVNAKSPEGETPLSVALRFGNVVEVKLLLAKGADVNVKFAGRDGEISLLMRLAANDKRGFISLLIDAGADVNFTAKWGYTVLMSAADDADVVEALVKAGARIDAEDVYGHNATCYALMKDQKIKLAKLLEYAPDSARWCRPQATTSREQ